MSQTVIGGMVSCTLTVNESVLSLPAPSTAVHSTVVSPIPNVLPDGGMHCTLTFLLVLSVAIALKFTIDPRGPETSAITGLTGKVIVGGTLSTSGVGETCANKTFGDVSAKAKKAISMNA